MLKIVLIFMMSLLLLSCSSSSEKDDEDLNQTGSAYTLLAWNDLGMHCFDGSDFSVFSILPPYNTLNAHLVKREGDTDKHISEDVVLTYESLSYQGSINTSSADKTNFWTYLPSLFPGATSTPDVGLTGYKTPSTTPQEMHFNTSHNWFEAEGIPIVNRDDNNLTNHYPMVRVVAKDTKGNLLATADVVLPVSDEMDCARCHASDASSDEAKPNAGWENSANALQDYKYNILRLHDESNPLTQTNVNEIRAKGYDYNSSLYDTAKAGIPILCASCHSSNALGTTGISDVPALTSAIHSEHATVVDPESGLELGASTNRSACYSCHPGAQTECLRGAMGKAKDENGAQIMQCQSCHGSMSDVGEPTRVGWLDQPNCQVCHQEGEQYTSALVNGSLRAVVDNRFATNPNTPTNGVSLYRYSTGHGDLQCSSCHGSTHAVFPTSFAGDNVLSEKLQGHSGTITECISCHATVPDTTTGGPHGLHTLGQSWVDSHEEAAEDNPEQCKTCHGDDYRGSVLSKTFTQRVFDADDKTQVYAKGDMVSCYDCHNGPNGD
ncbi:MAG: hypothetical protein U9Q40_03000 [Campylobacterota bacterium]|nr:hypothetical protein [Campylobacterota bacterium]